MYQEEMSKKQELEEFFDKVHWYSSNGLIETLKIIEPNLKY